MTRQTQFLGPVASALRLTPKDRDVLVAAGCMRFPGEVIQFAPPSPKGPKPGMLIVAAREYLRMQSPENGAVRALAVKYGLNYGSLLATISKVRDRERVG